MYVFFFNMILPHPTAFGWKVLNVFNIHMGRSAGPMDTPTPIATVRKEQEMYLSIPRWVMGTYIQKEGEKKN